jgi:ATP-dependent helicase Lhr and Lhr-like helicase
MSREEKLHLKAKLKFTWEVFFARFGDFTAIQTAAMPSLLMGGDCLLSAKTAGGKTEAATAPLIERLKSENWKDLSIIYISPTKALVSDLYNRLSPRLEQLRITIRQRTGDASYLNVHKPPQILITTPESFDVLLSREPKMFISVQAVVLDEIHLLDNSSRGDQLRLLLNRLRALRQSAFLNKDADTNGFQTVLLSATVSRPQEVADRYCQDAKVIEVAGKREIEYELIPLKNEPDLITAISKFKTRQINKTLVFCNSRSECEQYAESLRSFFEESKFNPFGENIFVHHSSLDKKVRQSTEERFGSAQHGICFATSTLELGIDIGDIDLVILVAPPSDLGSFLQRIGRGNRRTSKTVFWGFYRTERERFVFETLIKESENVFQNEQNYAFRPSVIVQQILSYLQQRRTGSFITKDFESLLKTSAGGVLLNKNERGQLLEHLVSERILKLTPRGEYTAGEKANDIYEKFQQYSNIESSGRGIRVVDELTGKLLGEIEERDLQNKQTFSFGGQKLNVVRSVTNEVIVSRTQDKTSNRRIRFLSTRAPLSFDLAQKMALRAGIKEKEFMLFQSHDKWILIHSLGTVYAQMLSQLLSDQKAWKSKATDLCLISECSPPKLIFDFEPEVVKVKLRRNIKSYEKLLRLGKFQPQLPEVLRHKAVEAAFNIEQFIELIKGTKIVEILMDDKNKHLALFFE